MSSESAERDPSMKTVRPSNSQNPSQKTGYNEEAFGKLGVDAVIFTVNTIQVAKAKIRYYWPSDETKNAFYSFIRRRPVLSSFLGLQLASISFPILTLLIYASCSAFTIAVGALLSLLTVLGVGLCIFVPTALFIMFITFWVWFSGYSMYWAVRVAYALYTRHFRSAQAVKEAKKEENCEAKEGDERKISMHQGRPNGVNSSASSKSMLPSSPPAQSASTLSRPWNVAKPLLDQEAYSAFSVPGLSPPQSAEEFMGNQLQEADESQSKIHSNDRQLEEMNRGLKPPKDAVTGLENNVSPQLDSKKASKDALTQEEKIASDIAKSLQ